MDDSDILCPAIPVSDYFLDLLDILRNGIRAAIDR